MLRHNYEGESEDQKQSAREGEALHPLDPAEGRDGGWKRRRGVQTIMGEEV
jgi:hypothetical protein